MHCSRQRRHWPLRRGHLPYPDDLKFHSSITLFAEASPEGEGNGFTAALTKYFDGRPDAATLSRL